MKQISLNDNHIREYVHLNEIEILHIDAKLNILGIFTKEIRDGARFRVLCSVFMRPIPWK